MTYDSLVGVRDCGCTTAWISIEHSSAQEIREFYMSMADTHREVRKANTDDIRGQLGICMHGGAA